MIGNATGAIARHSSCCLRNEHPEKGETSPLPARITLASLTITCLDKTMVTRPPLSLSVQASLPIGVHCWQQ